MLGLGDDYFRSDVGPTAMPGHQGHLMAAADTSHAAQDEFDRLASYILGTGNTSGTVTWLPGSKTEDENTLEMLNGH